MRYRLVAVSQEHPEGGSLTVERKSSEPRLNFAASTGRCAVTSAQKWYYNVESLTTLCIAESVTMLHAIIVES